MQQPPATPAAAHVRVQQHQHAATPQQQQQLMPESARAALPAHLQQALFNTAAKRQSPVKQPVLMKVHFHAAFTKLQMACYCFLLVTYLLTPGRPAWQIGHCMSYIQGYMLHVGLPELLLMIHVQQVLNMTIASVPMYGPCDQL